MSEFEIGGYKYSNEYGNPPIKPDKLKEDYQTGKYSKRSSLTLAVMMNLEDGKVLDIGKICKKDDYIAESFPKKISGFLRVNNVPFQVEVVRMGPRKGQGGKVVDRPLELKVRAL